MLVALIDSEPTAGNEESIEPGHPSRLGRTLDGVSGEADSDEPHHKSFKERLDPDGETEQIVKAFSSPLVRGLARLVGVDTSEIKDATKQYERLTSGSERLAAVLGPLGWSMFESASLDDYEKAAGLVEQGTVEEAEELLTASWNEDDCLRLNWAVHRIRSLYGGDEEREAIGFARQRLVREALDLHKEERYAAAIPLVLAQIDGVFLDMTGETIHDYFFKPKNPNLLDDETMAGHPLGLKALATMMSKRVESTGLTGELVRHGIIHGRELAYDTLTNSTKAFVALLVVIERVKRPAKELSDAAFAAHQARHAGSKERDEWGRMLDRRGFDEAKKTMFDVAAFQSGYHSRKGRYATDQVELDPSGSLFKERRFELRTTEHGQEYWGWVGTPPGIYFGAAGRGGDHPIWQYQGEEAPVGGIDSPADWRHVVNDEGHPDW